MSMLSSHRFAVLVVVVVCACSSDSSGGPPAGATVSTLAANAGNNQIGAAGQALATALSVVARDAGNNPVSGVTVTWAVASGGGSVAPATSTTDAAGSASASRTLGPGAGTQTTTATVAGVAPVTFSAVAQIQGATQMGSRFQSPLTDTVLATTIAEPLIALVTNQSGTPVPGVIVGWSASGGGAVSHTVDTTDAGGESQVNYTFGATAGMYGAQAAVAGLIGSPVSYTLTAGAGNPATIAKSAGDGLTTAPGGQVTHTVITRDAHGNPRNGVTIDWALGVGGGSLNTTQNITGGSGTASVTRTLGAGTGTQTVTAAANPALSPASVTFTTTAALIVQVGNNFFNPTNITVAAGSTVEWQWGAASNLHTITWDNPAQPGVPADEPNRSAGSVTRMLSTAGTFAYHCANHVGMTGQVTVTP